MEQPIRQRGDVEREQSPVALAGNEDVGGKIERDGKYEVRNAHPDEPLPIKFAGDGALSHGVAYAEAAQEQEDVNAPVCVGEKRTEGAQVSVGVHVGKVDHEGRYAHNQSPPLAEALDTELEYRHRLHAPRRDLRNPVICAT